MRSATIVRVAILLIGICLAVTASAGNITVDQATTAAENYLVFKASVDAWPGAATATVRLERTLEWNGETTGYYFEVEPDGWVLIPAFRELPPVKAYSEHGRITFDHPESFGAILEHVMQSKAQVLALYPDLNAMADDGIEVDAVRRYGTMWDVFSEPSRETFLGQLTENELDDYTPGTFLIESSWHQGTPYNNICPVMNQQQCWVGCVATATAQIMKYWNWPTDGVGSHSYTWQNQTLFADFSDAYDWSNMVLDYGQPGNYTQAQLSAVAELCYEVGVAFEMDYGLEGSVAFTSDAVTVLSTYFEYLDSVNEQDRDQYGTMQAWFDMLSSEINQERPMLYRIVNDDWGHAIVCDGWRISNTINQIHLNYGWDDGYTTWYALDAIYGSQYPDEEYVIRNIEPSQSPGIEWQEQAIADNFDGAYSVYAADVDGDGDLDVLGAAEAADDITWWENLDGAGLNWSEHTVDGAFDGANDVYASDVDGDGDLDVLGAAYNVDDIAWWENLDGAGDIWSEHTVDGAFDYAYSVYAADVDGDGDLDVLGAAYLADDITVWLQVGSPEPPDPVVVNITPAASPLIVPRGGWFEYNLAIQMNLPAPQNGYVWTMATLPNGLPYGPVFSVQFLFAPGMTISVNGIQQQVPGIAPLGTYSWIVNAGPNLFTPVGSDSFPFTVVAGNVTSSGDSPGGGSLTAGIASASIASAGDDVTVSGRAAEWTSDGQQRILAAANEWLAGDGYAAAEDETPLPEDYSVSAVYPNPFNASATLTITLPERAELKVEVYNIAGQSVATIADGIRQAGEHQLTFESSGLASGIYFVHATVPGHMNEVRKLMLVR